MPSPPASRKQVSLKDVARLSGVSTATVSRALNLPERVDVQTLERVRQAIARLRYVPHGAARALRSQRTYTLGAIVPSFDYALYARTTSALEGALDTLGYSLLLAAHHYDLRTEVRLTRTMIERGVEGFVFVGLDHDPELYTLLKEFARPYVLTWGVDRSGVHPSIGFDNRKATQAMASHLVSLGHRRIALITAPHEGNDRARERSAGVQAALAAQGIALDPGLIRYGSISLASGTAAMLELLALEPRPTAVIATNDVFAVGAMLACRDAGVRIPEQVSITGVDNTDLGATQTPPLASIRTPVTEVGRAAAAQLVARLDGKPFERVQELPFELVLRASVGPVKRESDTEALSDR